MRLREAARERRVLLRRIRPALDTSGGLDPRELGDEVRARDVELGREGSAVLVERGLLGDCGAPERAAHGNAPERARRAADLALDDLPVGRSHRVRRHRCVARQVPMPLTMKRRSPGFTSPSRRASRTSARPDPTARTCCSSWRRCAPRLDTSSLPLMQLLPGAEVRVDGFPVEEPEQDDASEREQAGRAQHGWQFAAARGAPPLADWRREVPTAATLHADQALRPCRV